MSMSDKNQTQTNQNNAPQQARPIAVRVVKFLAPTDVPGKNQASAVEAKEEPKGRARWVLAYLPWMRHHQITHTDSTGATRIGYVHESCVASWEPAGG